MRLFILLIFICGIIFKTAGQSTPDKELNSGISIDFDKYVQTALKTWKTPGISVAVVKNGQVIFKKAYGVRELGKPDIYRTSTLSTCASTTKAMTAVCMAMLVDEGKVKWSDRVIDILPAFKLSDPATTAQITIRDLFTHNSGLGNADFLWVYGYPGQRYSIVCNLRPLPIPSALDLSTKT